MVAKKDFLPADEFEHFQATVMGDPEKSKKCIKCVYGLSYGPASLDKKCHECAIKRKGNQE